jgi:hypothetical protein
MACARLFAYAFRAPFGGQGSAECWYEVSAIPSAARPDIDTMEGAVTLELQIRRAAEWPLQTRLHMVNLLHAFCSSRVAENELRGSVRVCRNAGLTWAQIGYVLGISRQACQKRFDR